MTPDLFNKYLGSLAIETADIEGEDFREAAVERLKKFDRRRTPATGATKPLEDAEGFVNKLVLEIRREQEEQ